MMEIDMYQLTRIIYKQGQVFLQMKGGLEFILSYCETKPPSPLVEGMGVGLGRKKCTANPTTTELNIASAAATAGLRTAPEVYGVSPP